MKKIVIAMLLMMAATFSTQARTYWHRPVNISIQTFYDDLSPYGDWIYSSDYGYVWRPFFDYPENFRPYSSRGNWVNTEYGWTWVSDYPWGWATFHYGRWYFDDYLGWMWIPGYEWAPAWVTWGTYNDYWGWAPLGPSINVSINFNWFAPDPWWTFVPKRHFCSHHWHHYIYDRPVVVNHITYITNVYNNNNRNDRTWFYGPRVNDVERHSQARVRQVRVIDNDRPDNLRIDNGQLRVYRPDITNDRENHRPAQVRTYEKERSSNQMKRQNARSNDPGDNRRRTVENDRSNEENIYRERSGRDAGMQRSRENDYQQPVRNTDVKNNRNPKTDSPGEIKDDRPKGHDNRANTATQKERTNKDQVKSDRNENRKSTGSSRISGKTNKNDDKGNSRKENSRSERSGSGSNHRK